MSVMRAPMALGELLAQVPGLLADQREGVAGLEGGDADRATGPPVDQHAGAVEAHELLQPRHEVVAVGIEELVQVVRRDARPGDRGAVPGRARPVQDGDLHSWMSRPWAPRACMSRMGWTSSVAARMASASAQDVVTMQRPLSRSANIDRPMQVGLA